MHDVLAPVFGFVFVVGAVLSLWLFLRGKASQKTQKTWLAVWLLVPPVCFWVEYFLFAPNVVDTQQTLGAPPFKAADINKLDLEKHKLARLNDFRQVSQAVWAGVAAVLGALFIRETKTSDQKESPQTSQTRSSSVATKGIS